MVESTKQESNDDGGGLNFDSLVEEVDFNGIRDR